MIVARSLRVVTDRALREDLRNTHQDEEIFIKQVDGLNILLTGQCFPKDV